MVIYELEYRFVIERNFYKFYIYRLLMEVGLFLDDFNNLLEKLDINLGSIEI